MLKEVLKVLSLLNMAVVSTEACMISFFTEEADFWNDHLNNKIFQGVPLDYPILEEIFVPSGLNLNNLKENWTAKGFFINRDNGINLQYVIYENQLIVFNKNYFLIEPYILDSIFIDQLDTDKDMLFLPLKKMVLDSDTMYIRIKHGSKIYSYCRYDVSSISTSALKDFFEKLQEIAY